MPLDDVVEQFSRRVELGEGAVFAGAGVSAGSALPSWHDLLGPVARAQLDLELTPDADLVAVAQWIVNRNVGNRGPLLARLMETIGVDAGPNDYHRALALSPVNCVWTTNYDDLLERGFAGRRLTVRHDDAALLAPVAPGGVEIVKVHGCLQRSGPSRVVLTQSDYEDFFARRPGMAARLASDLVRRSFLFIGYSYSDPNIRTALVQARRLGDDVTQRHWLLMTPPDPDRCAVAQLWANDLRRVGIEVVWLEDRSQLLDVLRAVARRSRGSTVYVTGSHLADRDDKYERLGQLLADQPSLVLLDGQSEGVGRAVLQAFARAVLDRRDDLLRRVRYFVNPYAINPAFGTDPALLGELERLRSALLRSAAVVVVHPGGWGTAAEVRWADDLGCSLLPAPNAPDDDAATLLSRLADTLPADYVALARDGRQGPEDVARCVATLLERST